MSYLKLKKTLVLNLHIELKSSKTQNKSDPTLQMKELVKIFPSTQFYIAYTLNQEWNSDGSTSYDICGDESKLIQFQRPQ